MAPVSSSVTFIAFWVEINSGGTGCQHRLYPGETQREVETEGGEREDERVQQNNKCVQERDTEKKRRRANGEGDDAGI